MILLVGDVDALEAVDVPRQASLVDVSLAGLNGLNQRIVYKGVLKKLDYLERICGLTIST